MRPEDEAESEDERVVKQASPSAKLGGMAGGVADPAALLRLYLSHGRLQNAAQLAIQHLTTWHKQVSNPAG